MLAEGPHHGDVGGLVLHQLHEDDACGILLLKHLHGLLQVVLTVEGAAGRDEQGRGLQEVYLLRGLQPWMRLLQRLERSSPHWVTGHMSLLQPLFSQCAPHQKGSKRETKRSQQMFLFPGLRLTSYKPQILRNNSSPSIMTTFLHECHMQEGRGRFPSQQHLTGTGPWMYAGRQRSPGTRQGSETVASMHTQYLQKQNLLRAETTCW